MKLTLALVVVATLLFGLSSTSRYPDSAELWKELMPQVDKILGKNYTFVEEVNRILRSHSSIPGADEYQSIIETTLGGYGKEFIVNYVCALSGLRACTVTSVRDPRI